MKIPKDNQDRQKLKIIFLGIASISGKLKCETGLHIGGGNDELKIGGIDKYVIKTADNKPYIPGSSFKGKTRSLFEKWQGLTSNRSGGDKIFRYEAEDIDTALSCPLSRLFGSTSKENNKLNFPARLVVRDFLPINFKLEKKSENTLDRLTAHANPRTNERVANNSEFKLQLDYNLEVITDEQNNIYLGNDSRKRIDDYLNDTINDFQNIFNTFILLEHSYLGGNGSRGYGRISFDDLKIEIMTVPDLLDNQTIPHNKQKSITGTSIDIKKKIIESQKDIMSHVKTYYEAVCSK